MQNSEALTGQQISEFLKGSEEISFNGQSRVEVYGWVQRVLVAQEFGRQNKKHRGAIRAYIEKVTGLSTPQVSRLIRQYQVTGTVTLRPSLQGRFPMKYTDQDMALLAEVDRAHERLSGATRCILQREYATFGQQKYVRLAEISSAHLYSLCRSGWYRKQCAVWEPTRPTTISLGERRKPDPQTLRASEGNVQGFSTRDGGWNAARGVSLLRLGSHARRRVRVFAQGKILCTGDAVANGPDNFTADGNIGNWPKVIDGALKWRRARISRLSGNNSWSRVVVFDLVKTRAPPARADG